MERIQEALKHYMALHSHMERIQEALKHYMGITQSHGANSGSSGTL